MKRWLCLALAALAPAAYADRLIVEDFSDVGTWRTWTVKNVTPLRWFGANLCLSGVPDKSRDDGYTGKLEYDFADNNPAQIDFQRFKVYVPEVFAKSFEFDANPRGVDCDIAVTMESSDGKRFTSPWVKLDGNEYKHYAIDLSSFSDKFAGPYKLYKLHFKAQNAAGANYILLDDLALSGDVSRKRQISIRPVLADLAVKPETAFARQFRLRNAKTGELKCDLVYRLYNFNDELVGEQFLQSVIPGSGMTVVEFAMPARPIGSYYGLLEIKSGKINVDYTDWVAVFEPNNGRKNFHPMWFGIQDTNIWNGPAENELHHVWMKQLGTDIQRLGFTGNRIEDGKNNNYAGIMKYVRQCGEAGMISCVMYGEGVPAYTQLQPGKNRMMGDNFEKFAEHADNVFQMLAADKSVQYLEFWNEPDIGFYNGTFDEYLEGLKIMYRAKQKHAPQIKLTTGGVTVIHPKEKKNFSRDMYQRGKGFYDVACFHAHGSLQNYVEREELVEKWLKEADIDVSVCNTETGERSGYTVDTIKRHCQVLLKKITYAKSRHTEFYMWFTLQDYWDMDAEADDSFGLVTSDNRPKPAFLVYNELIRQLGDTNRGEFLKSDTLDIYRFVNDKTDREVLVVWPKQANAVALLSLAGKGMATAVDMFGRTLESVDGNGQINVNVPGAPVYVNYAKNAYVLSEPMLAQSVIVGARADSSVTVPVTAKNTGKDLAVFTVTGNAPFELAAGQTRQINQTVKLPANLKEGVYTEKLSASVKRGTEAMTMSIPLSVNIAYPAVGPGGKPADIVLDNLAQVHEMSFDPNIPRWKDPKDLSVELSLSHDDKDMILHAVITDDKHVMSNTPENGWKDDSIQIGFANIKGQHTELTLSGKDGTGGAWAHISTAGATGLWDVPVSVKAANGKTVYDVRMPLAKLGIAPDKGTVFRFAFLVNENDGQGRVRWIEYYSGIGRSKNPDEYAFGVIE